MKYFSVKNLDRFQHYKDRNPTWIKLYTALLSDMKFNSLTEVQQLHLIKIWILSSQNGSRLVFDSQSIRKRLGLDSRLSLKVFVEAEFIEIIEDSEENASKMVRPYKSNINKNNINQKEENTLSSKPDLSPSENPTTPLTPKPSPTAQAPPKPPGLKLEDERSREEFAIRWQRYRGEKDSRKLASGYWNTSVKTQEDLADYDKAEQNYYAIVEADRGNGFAGRRYKNGKTWFNNWRNYIDQEPQAPPQKKPKDGIFPAPQLDQEDLKSKIETQVAFVRRELAEGVERDSDWLRMALGKFVEEYQQRFSEDPLGPDEQEWFQSLFADLEVA